MVYLLALLILQKVLFIYLVFEIQVNENKALEKKIKALKAKLSDENVSVMTLEAKLADKQGKGLCGVWTSCVTVQNNRKTRNEREKNNNLNVIFYPYQVAYYLFYSLYFNFYCCCLNCSVQQTEEMLKAAEKEREEILSEETKKLNGVRSQIELKLKLLEPREREAEAMVSKV